MMQVSNLSGAQVLPGGSGQTGGGTGASDAERRQRASEAAAQEQAAKARSADRLAEIRAAVARVLGANTRLSIARSETGFSFIYRAIDINSGEVVFEWPENKFMELVRGVSQDVRADVDAGHELGNIFDRVA